MENIKKPSLFLFFTEGVRFFIDFFHCLFFLRSYRFTTKGDGHPVLVVPGLLCSDFSTRLLRNFLNKLGYTAYGWELGINLGNLKDLRDIKRLEARIDEIYKQHNEKITLIGWSMGGIYTREIAKMKPELFHQIITLGSPFADSYAPNNVLWLFKYIQDPDDLDIKWRDNLPTPAPIRTTAVYSKQDGLVPWEICREQVEDNLHQNIETRGSHWGLVTNYDVFNIIARQLEYYELEMNSKTKESDSFHSLNNGQKYPYLA